MCNTHTAPVVTPAVEAATAGLKKAKRVASEAFFALCDAEREGQSVEKVGALDAAHRAARAGVQEA